MYKTHSYQITSSALNRRVTVDITGPAKRAGAWVLLNDGQLAASLRIAETAERMHKDGLIPPLHIAAIHASNRLAEYGVSGEADYLGRGARAAEYERFVTSELLPWLQQRSGNQLLPQRTVFAGFSLGGLSAFDIAASNTDLFSGAGIFSGSLWWRSKSYEQGYTDQDRILFRKHAHRKPDKNFRCFLMAGTCDELNDRNENGVIDSVDDTLDLYELLSTSNGLPAGHVRLSIVAGGRHDTETWKLELPSFLEHCFAT